MIDLIFNAIEQGVLYGLLAIGIYVAFRILDIPDLTTEGSFTIGLSISAMAVLAGHPILGIVLGVLGGMAAGTVTGVLQTTFEIHPILSGILTMSGAYTVNLFIMGGTPSVNLMKKTTVFSMFEDFAANTGVFGRVSEKMVLAIIVAVIVLAVSIFFFKTRIGLCIRAVGDNKAMVSASSINVSNVTVLAIALSNGCIALCGALITQYQNFANINDGAGTLIVGLASVIIGETVIGKRGVTAGVISAVLGSVIYRIILATAMRYMMFPAQALKLVSAIIVAAALAIPAAKKKFGVAVMQLKNRRNGNA